MKITTEAHGAFPSEQSLKSIVAKIAFVNSDTHDRYLRATQVSEDLLILAADDLSEDAIPAWIKGLLKLPPTLSSLVKHHLWNNSLSKGFPNAPLSLGDAVAILDFYEKLRARDVDHLIISCEYGKSRSVTTARFLKAHLQNEAPAEQVAIPNAWVHHMLEHALTHHTKNY